MDDDQWIQLCKLSLYSGFAFYARAKLMVMKLDFLSADYNTSLTLNYNFASGGATVDATLVAGYEPIRRSYHSSTKPTSSSPSSVPNHPPRPGLLTTPCSLHGSASMISEIPITIPQPTRHWRVAFLMYTLPLRSSYTMLVGETLRSSTFLVSTSKPNPQWLCITHSNQSQLSTEPL